MSGITAMLLCCLLFVFNDALVKYGTETLSLGQLLLIRSTLATMAVTIFAWRRRILRRPRLCFKLPVLVRSAADGAATVFYTIGLVHMPIANACAIGQITPLAITAASALVLREIVGWRRWLSVAFGFLGMLTMVRPGSDGFNVWSLMIALSVALIVVRDLSTRFVDPDTDNILLLIANLTAITLVAGGMAAFEPWQPVDFRNLVVIVAAGVFVIGGIVFSIEAMQHGDVSLISPFRYSALLFALLIGFMVWGDTPDPATLIGTAIVVASGLYILYAERQVGQTAAHLRPGYETPAPAGRRSRESQAAQLPSLGREESQAP